MTFLPKRVLLNFALIDESVKRNNRRMKIVEVIEVEKQTITFPVAVTEGIVTDIGRSYTTHPKIRFNGNDIKWYQDKPNDKSN